MMSKVSHHAMGEPGNKAGMCPYSLAMRLVRVCVMCPCTVLVYMYVHVFSSYISYPRTETNMFPESFDLQAIVKDQTGDPTWGGQLREGGGGL